MVMVGTFHAIVLVVAVIVIPIYIFQLVVSRSYSLFFPVNEIRILETRDREDDSEDRWVRVRVCSHSEFHRPTVKVSKRSTL